MSASASAASASAASAEQQTNSKTNTMMQVLKRCGQTEEVSFDKVLNRLRVLSNDLAVNYLQVAQSVISRIYPNVATSELDEMAANMCSSMILDHPDYGKLASRIIISNHHKNTSPSFSETINVLMENRDKKGQPNPLVSDKVFDIVMRNKEKLNSYMDYSRDYAFDYFGFKTLEKAYLMRSGGKVIERPQHMFMRVALGIHGEDNNLRDAIQTYDLMSQRYFVHATPTLFNAGTPRPQLSSCFVAGTEIVTINDGVKKIEDVKVGDLVVTHNGNIKPVSQLHRNPLNDRDVYKLQVVNSKPIYVTGNHRFWTTRKKTGAGKKYINSPGQWIAVDDIKTGDLIAIPNVGDKLDGEKTVIDVLDWLSSCEKYEYKTIENDFVMRVTHWKHSNLDNNDEVSVTRKSKLVSRFWDVDTDFMNFAGIFLGDGNITTHKGKPMGISVTIYVHNHKEIDYVISVGERIFKHKHSIHKVKDQNVLQVQFHSCVIGEVFQAMFGKGFAHKELPKWIFSQPSSNIKALLAGLLTTDGCIAKNGIITLQLSNKPIINQLYHLLRMHGMEVSFRKGIDPKKSTHTQAWVMSVPFIDDVVKMTYKYYPDNRVEKLLESRKHLTNPGGPYMCVVEGQKFIRVKHIERTENKPEFVYTLGIEDDHSYPVEGLLAENCYLVHTKDDSIEGIYDSLKDCAFISKYAGGIGIHIHNIRARNSMIRGTNGVSTGIVPMLRVFNNTARYVNQCFAPETPVYTLDRGMIPIVDVSVGDRVMTSDGTFKPVLRKFANPIDREILEIHGHGLAEPIRVTNEHKILVRNMVSGNVGYKYADEINVREDAVGFAQHTEVGTETGAGRAMVAADNAGLVFYGMFLIAGRIFSNGYDFCLTASSPKMQMFATNFLQSRGIRPWIYKNRTRKTVLLRWVKDTIKLPELSYFKIYDEEGRKRLAPLYMSSSADTAKSIIHGMTLAGTPSLRGEFVDFKTDNIKMYNDVRYLCRRFGLRVVRLADLRVQIAADWELEMLDVECAAGLAKKQPRVSWEMLSTINRVHYTGNVYDLNVQDNHNYTTALGIVHNSGRRNGSIAVYLEPWHADVFDFLDLKKNHGTEDERARDLFYAMWINDLFMERVKADGVWSLMCPDECPGLSDVWGAAFESLYISYEQKGQYVKQVRAQELWFKILESQIETGTPYILYKDSINRKSNQSNLGTIKSSNLCVAPETKILTDTGYHTISTLKDQAVRVWNGKEFSDTVVHQTGTNQKLLTVTFDNGMTMRCTPYHKFYIVEGDGDAVKEVEYTAEKLKAGMQIYPYIMPKDDGCGAGQTQSPIILEVSDKGEVADTYCFNEPKRNRGVFNGILTGQCVEIMEYTSPTEIAVCNLASICLPEYYSSATGIFDYKKLHEIAKVITRNINKVIDINYYPVPEARTSNMRHRPIGVGVQGLADVYVLMRLAFDSPEAAEVNKRIFETIYHGALEASMELAKQRAEDLASGVIERDTVFDPPVGSKYPGAYMSFDGCPASNGILQFDMWGVTPVSAEGPGGRTPWDWPTLKEQIKKYGLRNSLLLAPMPTASTSQIMGWNECFEPYASNIYKRKTLAGEFILVNKFLVEDLSKLGLWNQDIKNKILTNDGSVQSIKEIPDDIKVLYKTVWEIKQKVVIDQAADRGAYICQSQSMNLFMDSPDFKKLSSMHFYAWGKGLKTGMYYLRTKTKAKTQQFTMDVSHAKFTNIKLDGPAATATASTSAAAAVVDTVCDDDNGVCMTCSA